MTVPMPPTPRDANGGSSRAPGHNLDAFQPRLDVELLPVTADVVSVTATGMVYLFVGGTTQAWWTHDPDRARALVENLGSSIDLHRGHGVIAFADSDGAWHALSIAPIDDATACRPVARALQLAIGCRSVEDTRIPPRGPHEAELRTLIAA